MLLSREHRARVRRCRGEVMFRGYVSHPAPHLVLHLRPSFCMATVTYDLLTLGYLLDWCVQTVWFVEVSDLRMISVCDNEDIHLNSINGIFEA